MSPNSCVRFFAGWRGSLLYDSLYIQRSLFISIGLFSCKYDSFVAPERGWREHILGMQLLRVCCPCDRYGIRKCVQTFTCVGVSVCVLECMCMCERKSGCMYMCAWVWVCTCRKTCVCTHIHVSRSETAHLIGKKCVLQGRACV